MAVAEQTKPQAQQAPQEARSQGSVAIFQPPRIPYHPAIEQRFGVDQAGWRALIDAVWPGAKSADAVALALSYCKARKLDPFKKPVHIVPVWNSALGREVESVWPGIGELRTTAFRTGHFAGCDATEFGPDKAFTFSGRVKAGKDKWEDRTIKLTAPEWAQITVYRIVGGQRFAFPGPRVYFLAAYGRKGKSEIPNDKWEQMPSYMLEKVAEAAALRKAFPEEMGDMQTAEEMEGRQVVDIGQGQTVETPPERPQRSQFAERAAPVQDVNEQGEAEPAQQADDAGGAAEDSAGLSLVNGVGEIVEEGLGDAAFAIGLSKLFEEAGDHKLLRTIWDNNEEAAKSLPEPMLKGVTADYDTALMRVKPKGAGNRPGQGDMLGGGTR